MVWKIEAGKGGGRGVDFCFWINFDFLFLNYSYMPNLFANNLCFLDYIKMVEM